MGTSSSAGTSSASSEWTTSPRSPRLSRSAWRQLTGDSLATMIYTSGTTGRPKGVELPHSNWVFMGASIQALDILHEPDLHFLWLPLSHVLRQGAARRAVPGRLDDGHRRTRAEDLREPREAEPDRHGRRSAHLREDLPGSQLPRRSARVAPRPRSSPGPSNVARASRRRSGRQVGRAVRRASRWPSPTSWSSRRSARRPAATSRSWSPGPRLSTGTSPAGSTPRVCRSSRATA